MTTITLLAIDGSGSAVRSFSLPVAAWLVVASPSFVESVTARLHYRRSYGPTEGLSFKIRSLK